MEPARNPQRQRRLPALLVVVLLLAAGVRSQDTRPRTIAGDRLAELDRIFAAHVAGKRTPALAVAIVEGGRIVLAKAYGKRSIEPDRDADTATRFAIGSVTKQFTCACVLLLAEAGKLSVSDPVAKHYPHLKRADDVTLLDLMNHTSGYPDYYPLDFVDRRMATPIEADALIEEYAGVNAKLDFEPGTAWSYSNTGYILLGRIVEKVGGQPFGEFLRQRIFAPLGMTRTLYDPDPSRAEIARGYTTFALGPPEPNTPEAKGWVGAAGGIYTTAADLATWNIALMTGKLLRPMSWSLMTRARRLHNGSLTQYGCGLSIAVKHGQEMLAHGGAISGFAAWNGMFPAAGAAVVLLSNQDGGLGPLPDRVRDVLLREPPAARPTPVPTVQGPAAIEVVRRVFVALQRGEVDRGQLTADFDDYLSAGRVAAAAKRLAPLGEPDRVELVSRRERGGMEVTITRVRTGDQSVEVLMYRRVDGSIAQFFVRR